MKNKKIIVEIIFVFVIVLGITFLITREKTYSIRITVPAHSSDTFIYSDTEISSKTNKIIIFAGDGLGDCEVVLKSVEATDVDYEPTYLTPGMPVRIDVEKDVWFKIGVSIQNLTDEDVEVYINVKNVDLRIE